MKIDACLWAKNGTTYLPSTLERFDSVVPNEVIGQRIFVDDHSKDNSVRIARDFNWTIYENPSGGIVAGANEALRHVSTDLFMSIEQDVLLSTEWWPRIYHNLCSKRSVAVSQGVRFFVQPALRILYEEKVMQTLERMIRNGDYRSIDNTIFRTKVIRGLGGFPHNCPKCVDWWLRKNVESHGYKWLVDSSIVSAHLRSSVWGQASQQARYDASCTCGLRKPRMKLLLKLALTSPQSGIRLALSRKMPLLALLYPFMRYRILGARLMTNSTHPQ